MQKFVFLSLAFFLSFCQDRNLIPECDSECFLYTSNQIIAQDDIYFESYGKLIPENGHVVIVFFLKNKSKNDLFINYAQAQLTTKEHIRSGPIQFSDMESKLAPNQHITDSLIFKPINSLKLFQSIQHKGDLKKEYGLSLDFIQNAAGNQITEKEILFSAAVKDYDDYIKNYGEEEAISIFYPQDQSKTTQEFLINGVNNEFTAYAIKNNLFINIRIVNHGEKELIVIPDAFQIHENPAQTYDSLQNIILRKGDRYTKAFEYTISPQLKEFQLGLRGIKYQTGKPLFENDLYFKKEN